MTTIDEIARGELLAALEGPNWTARAKGAERLAAFYCEGELDAASQRLAEDSFRWLRLDGEVLIRRLLAECLKQASQLPRDIALSLATDEAEVAAPFLEHSPVLTESDLLAILGAHSRAHRLAIARRQPLSDVLSDALCRCGESEVVLAVLGNDHAHVPERTLGWLLGNPARPPGLHEAIARRKMLPIGIGDRLCAIGDRSRAAEADEASTARGRAEAV